MKNKVFAKTAANSECLFFRTNDNQKKKKPAIRMELSTITLCDDSERASRWQSPLLPTNDVNFMLTSFAEETFRSSLCVGGNVWEFSINLNYIGSARAKFEFASFHPLPIWLSVRMMIFILFVSFIFRYVFTHSAPAIASPPSAAVPSIYPSVPPFYNLPQGRRRWTNSSATTAHCCLHSSPTT